MRNPQNIYVNFNASNYPIKTCNQAIRQTGRHSPNLANYFTEIRLLADHLDRATDERMSRNKFCSVDQKTARLGNILKNME
jgi:hypothetical protein